MYTVQDTECLCMSFPSHTHYLIPMYCIALLTLSDYVWQCYCLYECPCIIELRWTISDHFIPRYRHYSILYCGLNANPGGPNRDRCSVGEGWFFKPSLFAGIALVLMMKDRILTSTWACMTAYMSGLIPWRSLASTAAPRLTNSSTNPVWPP